MGALSVEFEKLKTSTFAYQDERRRTTEQRAQPHMNKIIALLISIPLLAKQTPKPDVLLFVEQNKGTIYRIYYILAKGTELYISDSSQQKALGTKTLHLMHMLHILNVKRFFERLPTDYLTDFCKGITYFKGEVVSERPFYHRDSSCGTGSLTSQQKFSNSKADKSLKNQVYKCYLERTIYDRIFTDILHYQDIPHLAELRKMERYYQDNFEERRIFAFIGYKNQIEPTSLLITTYTNDNARDKIEERYDKTRTNLVKCTRGIFKDDKRVAYYTKEQTEDKEAQWIELTLGTLLKHTTSASSSKNAKTTKATVRFNGGKKLPLQTHMS